MQEFEVTPEQAKEWKRREQARIDDGTYVLPPWSSYAWYYLDGDYGKGYRYPDHYAHISIDRLAMIAFTENDQKGVRDRQTRVSPGKYLAKFFGHVLSPKDIQALATEMGAKYNDDAELLFAETADEFEEVYTTGPNSCMSHAPDHFDSCVHPVRVYAGFDLQLAYLMRNDRITARSLCWPEKKIYSRVYGDETRLGHALRGVGYNPGSLSGAKITKLYDGDDLVIPYLDYLAGAYDGGDHLELSERGGKREDGKRLAVCGDRQNGLGEDRSNIRCAECGDGIDVGDGRSNDDGTFCDGCWDDRYGYCERTEDSVLRDELEDVRTRRHPNGGWRTQQWGEYARDEHAFFCDHHEVWYSGIHVAVEIDGETWGPQAIDDDAVMCAATDEYIRSCDSVHLEDGTVWSKDHFADHGVTIDGKLYDEDNCPDADGNIVRASPTVVCDAQIEAPLVQGPRIEPVVSFGEIRWRVMDGENDVHPYHYYVKANAESALAGYIATQPRIVPGCQVECIETYNGSGFTIGRLYTVTRVFDCEDGTKRISIVADDNMRENGWLADKFRFHSACHANGLHIRHEPENDYTGYPYRLYDGDHNVNGWSAMNYALAGLRMAQERTGIFRDTAPQQGLHVRREPQAMWPYKVYYHNLYLDGFSTEPDAQDYYEQLNRNPDRLLDLIVRRRAQPIRTMDLIQQLQTEEIAI